MFQKRKHAVSTKNHDFLSHFKISDMIMAPEKELHFLKDASCSDSAKIHGVIASISPMKKGKSAFFKCRIV